VQRCQADPACFTDAAGFALFILKDLQVLQRSQSCQLWCLCTAADCVHSSLLTAVHNASHSSCELCEAHKGSSFATRASPSSSLSCWQQLVRQAMSALVTFGVITEAAGQPGCAFSAGPEAPPAAPSSTLLNRVCQAPTRKACELQIQHMQPGIIAVRLFPMSTAALSADIVSVSALSAAAARCCCRLLLNPGRGRGTAGL
jgi:hypothetical protein